LWRWWERNSKKTTTTLLGIRLLNGISPSNCITVGPKLINNVLKKVRRAVREL